MVGEQRLPEFEMAAPQTATRDSWLDRPLLAALNWETALYALFILLAIATRFWDAGARVMSHDESLHTYFSYQLATGKGFQHTPLMHGPFLFHITALSYFLFGADDFTSRIPPAVFGVALVTLPYFFRRWLGRAGALATSFMLLISPSILYHARYIRQEEFVLVWMTLTVLCIWRYLADRQPGWLVGLSAVLAFHATDKSTSFLAVALLMVFLSPLALWQLYRMRNKWRDAAVLVGFGALTAVLMLGLSVLFELGGNRLAALVGMDSMVSSVQTGALNLNTSNLLFVFIMLLTGALICIGLTYLYRVTFGAWLRTASVGSAAFNVIIVLVTTTMFMASPAMLLVKNRIWQRFQGEELVPISTLGNMANLQSNPQVISTMFAMSLALIVIAIAIGVAWNWRRWVAIIGVFLAITITLFTTVFTNTAGIGTGFVGQLGYWMAQQDVKRGSQPWYYYGLIVPMYEYTVLIGAVAGMSLLAVKLFMAALRSRVRFLAATAKNLFPIFLSWWTIATWIIYTIAGEKMPWLSVHFALPMAMLSGWFIQQLASALWASINDKQRSRWMAVGGLAVLSVLLSVRLLSLIGGLNLSGADRAEALQWGLSFALSALALAVVAYYLGRAANGGALPAFGLAAFGVLSVLTIRTAVNVTYINYDYTKEFLFYAHGAPGVKVALKQIDDLSARLGGREPLKIGYTQETSWPLSWYMRSYPGARYLGGQLPGDYQDLQVILASEQDSSFAQMAEQLAPDYTRFDYMLVWWPMQDYYDLNWDRVSYSLFNPEARAALWEIAFNRNFEPYSKLFNKSSLTPATWSPGHRFSLFVRNDMADQLWDYRTGAVASGGGSRIAGPKLTSPAGLAFAADGTRYLIDHKSNRVFRQDVDGSTIATWGGSGNQPGKFNDAWGLMVDPAQNVYVADTFNHRIQKFDPNGNVIITWGRPGATNEPGIGSDTQFFGPRDIAIDSKGQLLVTDTGNKRVQVFDQNGNFITQFGSPGDGNGQFNEPVGVAADANGNIYVADTWNKRIQVFDPNFQFLRAFPVAAWEQMEQGELQGINHKPYLAVDGNTLYVSSPGTAQVLGFSLTGSPVDLPSVTFAIEDLPTGVRVQNGALFVTNAHNGQVLEFPLGGAAQ